MRCYLALVPVLLGVSVQLHAAPPPVTTSDWGTIGLLQTPTARMSEAGEVSFTYSKTDPYIRYNFMLQPFDWLEAGFRYIDVTNRLYGPSYAGNQSYKDKSIDAKFRLVEESRYVPQLAVGLRDIGGTGLFAGEYVVASKRLGAVDASLGLGWGYLGASGSMSNPLGIISDKLDDRPDAPTQAGGFNTSAYFRGRTALFGGIQYQTPHAPLLLKLEYEGNDYQSEPQANDQEQDSPVNIGMVYRLSPGIDLHAAFERGNTAMFGFTLHTNLAKARSQSKLLDPPKPAFAEVPPQGATADWGRVADALESQAGWTVQRIRQRGDELIIEAEQGTYIDPKESMDRTARVLQPVVPAHVRWFTVQNQINGLRSVDWSVNRQAFSAQAVGEPVSERPFEAASPALVRAETVFEQKPEALSGGFSLGYDQSVGGPDGFLLYQITANANGTWRPRKDFRVDATLSARVLDNYQDFDYTGPSKLPRVRTFVREYLTTERVTLPLLQATKTWQPTADVFVMAYGGLLESMFGGVGVEWLYRPYGERWAIGVDVNAVQQRDFEQDFGFRDYRTATGHVTFYADTGIQDIQAKVHVGRYLAKDNGVTVDLSRRFGNGVSMGAFATLTDVSREEFGEGSFDKGIYVSIPFDLMLLRSSRAKATMTWNPLTRDGGQMLSRSMQLYELTGDRDHGLAK